MIYVDALGGLCNRMRAIASAVDVAKKHNEEIQLFWHLNKECNCHLNDLFLPINGVGGVFETTHRLTFRSAIKRLTLPRFLHCKKEALGSIEETLRAGRNIYIRTPHQFGNVDEFKMFSPTPELMNQANNILGGKTDVVGIHIRRTDNVKSISYSPTELFIASIREELEKNPETEFFLATDSDADRETIIKSFPNKIITQKNIELSRNSPEGIKRALVDLICLSKCRMIMGSYWSSFSETAALWNGEKELRVIKI